MDEAGQGIVRYFVRGDLWRRSRVARTITGVEIGGRSHGGLDVSDKMDFTHPRDAILRAIERIYRYRMTTTSGGNLSMRDEGGEVWITPARVDKGTLRREDIIRVRADGTADGPHPPSSELPFHRAIYAARPDLRAIVHAHPVALVAFSICGRVPDTRLLPTARRVCGRVGFAPYALPGSEALGQADRAGVRGRLRLRGAGEPRRGHRRLQPPGGIRAVRDAGVLRQDDHQGRPARRGPVPGRRAGRAAAAGRDDPARVPDRDRPPPRSGSCGGNSASSSAAVTGSGS